MNTETVDLIATDPPFKKGRDFHALPDSLAKGASFQDRWSWKDNVHESWIDKITDDFPKVMNVINGSRNSYGDDMGAFLCFMGVRILEMRRVLKYTGSLYLHCDPTASHYLKELLDSIFGKKCFRNEIIWKKTNSTKEQTGVFGRQHDVIFWYSKSDKYVYNKISTPIDKDEKPGKAFRHDDNDGMGPYQTIALSNTTESGGFAKMKTWEWRGVRARWIYSKQNLEKWWKEGRIVRTKSGYRKKDYWTDKQARGNVVTNIWADKEVAPIQADARTGYPTQKPIPLYARIIKASSNKGEIVLDPFCGCATTCVAAEMLGRKWIGIDIWAKAHKVVINRLKKEGCLSGPGEERHDLMLTEGEITYTKQHFKRTDTGSEAVPFLETQMKQFDDTVHDPHTNKEKKCMLLEQYGSVCQGCGFELHERYLELDHKEPRSGGGSNLIGNRILLCGPCNKLKRDWYTLVWLRRENKKRGYMINEEILSALKG